MALTRKQSWPEDLARFLETATDRPFAWGSWDCCLAAADAVEAMTGEDVALKVRGQYDTKMGAARIVKGNGKGLEKAVRHILSHRCKEIPVSRASRGDLVLVNVTTDEGEESPAMGVVDLRGTHVAVAAAPRGLAYVPLAQALRAWKVGA